MVLRPGRDMSLELKAWRATCGYSETDAAGRLGIDAATYRRWESGEPVQFPSMIEAAIGAPLGRVIFPQ